MPPDYVRHMLLGLHSPPILLDVVLYPRNVLGHVHMHTQVKQRLLPRWALDQERPGGQRLQRLKPFHRGRTQVGRCQVANSRTRVDNADFGYLPRRDNEGRPTGRHGYFGKESRSTSAKDESEDYAMVELLLRIIVSYISGLPGGCAGSPGNT